MSTIAMSIAPKLLELETSNLADSFVLGMPIADRTNAQIIFPKCKRGLAARPVQWGT